MNKEIQFTLEEKDILLLELSQIVERYYDEYRDGLDEDVEEYTNKLLEIIKKIKGKE